MGCFDGSRLLDQKASKQSAESAESAGFSVEAGGVIFAPYPEGDPREEKAHELLAQLDFHFHCDKDPDCSVSSTECTELLQALKDMRKKLTTLQKDAAVLEEKCVQRANQPRKASKAPASYVEMKVQLLLSYLISLTYYLLLKVKGVSLRDHPVVLRLLWIRTLIEKLKPVDQRLQYQMNKLLQWKDAKAAEQLAGSTDAHALRPGQLVASVQDEDAEDAQEAEELASAPKDEEGHLGAYKPPKISQVEYTGDHISMQERAEKELDRKKARLERSEFMRSLREEFTDAPREIMAEERSARVEKATRMLREQQEFEEDTMQRVKVKKAELRRQKQALREGHATSGGAVSLFDVASDFGEIMRGAGKGKGRFASSPRQTRNAPPKRKGVSHL
ncbi:Neuroguidin (EIF4E-binding protein) [Durusdinium trenchii]|uniref:Neuroguidin (EIF4E-binding protein) n=1 Tax=Durusdinium trenchii TaxID=1381693 RepID=A0ABP0M7I3_9DINO